MSDFDAGTFGDISNLVVNALAGGSVTGVSDTVLTTICTYTAAQDRYVSHISVSGTVYAKYQIYLNMNLLETRRGGPDRTLVFEWNKPLHLNSGDILDVKVTHFVTGASEEFEATVYGA